MKIRLLHGDCKIRMAGLPESSVGAVIVDPPYGLSFMGKDWDKMELDAEEVQMDIQGMYGQQLWHVEWLREAFRLLQPGGVAKVFCGTRTFHRLAAGMVDVGFTDIKLEAWGYGSGFPKSMNIGKALDKMYGAEREKIRVPADQARNPKSIRGGHGVDGGDRPWMQKAQELGYHEKDSDEPATEDAALWNGWGTALKPAWEPVVIGIKPGGPGSPETP